MATCLRHPNGARHRGLCAACLLEEALAPPAAPLQPERIVTIQLPLGRTAASSVFLVKGEGPVVRLLRLKRWHSVAPPAFMSRFARLQRELSDWRHALVPAPLAASVDGFGRASVLDEFRQGLPIVEAVASGSLDGPTSEAWLATLAAVAREAHMRGLVHGSIRGSNVLVDIMRATVCFLDFGHAGLMAREGDDGLPASKDDDGLARLSDAIRQARPAHPGHASNLPSGFR